MIIVRLTILPSPLLYIILIFLSYYYILKCRFESSLNFYLEKWLTKCELYPIIGVRSKSNFRKKASNSRKYGANSPERSIFKI